MIAYFKKVCILKIEISDFHKLTAVSLKSQILKASPKWKLYRYYKAFDENSFSNDLKTQLYSIKILVYYSFEYIFINILNTHAPIATKGSSKSNNDKI